MYNYFLIIILVYVLVLILINSGLRNHVLIDKKELNIMSFNVLAPNWIDDFLKKEVSSNYLDEEYRIKKHIEIIHKENPDVLFLQEVTESMLNKYQSELPHYSVSSCFAEMKWIPLKEVHDGNAIMWKKNLFLGDSKCTVVTLDESHGNYTSVVKGILFDNKPITLICIHLEWGNYNIASEQFRNIFRKNITNEINQRCIIAGDFNMGGYDISKYPIISDIKNLNFTDPLNGVRTHPFIDDLYIGVSHILSRGFQKILNFGSDKSINIEHCLKLFGSDHYPIYTTLLL